MGSEGDGPIPHRPPPPETAVIEPRLNLPEDPDRIAGQMVLCGFAGKTLPDEVRRALAEGRLAGVVLFARNLGGPDEVRALTGSIRAASELPPLVAVDQEGGRVSRLQPPFTQWPSMRALGRRDDPALAREIAAAVADELLAVGINLNFAPVLDVDSNPSNPVIGDRSLGPKPERVTALGAAMIEGFLSAGLLCCAKHFPGHGDTGADSHQELPTVTADRATISRRELPPFAAAIAAGVPVVMAAHVKFTALDHYYPASISPRILDGLLREELGFRGVIVTDDLEMGALMKNMPLTDAAFAAARAGADLLLVCSGPAPAEAARRALKDAMRMGALSEGRSLLSVQRALALKERFTSRPAAADPRVIGCVRHQELAERVRGG